MKRKCWRKKQAELFWTEREKAKGHNKAKKDFKKGVGLVLALHSSFATFDIMVSHQQQKK